MSASHSLGTYLEGGFPNIKGEFYSTWDGRDVSWGASGAFYTSTISAMREAAGSIYYINVPKLHFDASRYNPIFRDDVTTVQPPAYTVYFIIRLK